MPTGPTAGSETLDVLEFLGRVVSHIPNKGQVLQRYYGWYANRTRGIRRRAATHGQASASPVEVESVPPSLQEARRRWAEPLGPRTTGSGHFGLPGCARARHRVGETAEE